MAKTIKIRNSAKKVPSVAAIRVLKNFIISENYVIENLYTMHRRCSFDGKKKAPINKRDYAKI
jgi:hypothetical protein